VETTRFKVTAALRSMKVGQDGAIDLVIAQPHKPRHRMTVEFPASACTKGSTKRAVMRSSSLRS